MDKSQLTFKCRQILKHNKNRYLNAEDKHFLLTEILPWHENYDEKVGCGVKDIVVNFYKDERRHFTNWCFYLIRKDGTKTYMSYVHSIANKPNYLCKEDY